MQPFGSTLPLPPLPKTSPYNQILDNLYVGGIQSSEKNWNDFRLIVNCTKDIPFQSQEYGMDSPECIRIPVNDTPDECENFLAYICETDVLKKMNQSISEGKPVLVHCYAGAQRSCALVACYLMEYCLVTPEEAMEHIRKCRPIAFFCGANFLLAIRRFYTKTNWRLT